MVWFRILTNQSLYLLYILFDDLSVVHMYVAGYSLSAFFDFDNLMEQFLNTLSCTSYRRYYRYSEQSTQLQHVELVSACTQFVVHIQSHNHRHVHIDELGSEVEVAFQIACIHHVYDDIGSLLDDVSTHIQLLRCVGSQGIGTRQVGKIEVVAFEIELSLLSIYGNSGVVANPFVCSTCYVEYRCLSAVWISNEYYIQFVFLHASYTTNFLIGRNTMLERVLGCVSFCFLFVDYFHQFCLGTTQTHLVVHHLIFYWIAQGGIEQNLYGLTLNESHFYDSFSEASVSMYMNYDACFACL